MDDKLSQTYEYLKNQRKNVFYLMQALKEIDAAVKGGEKSAKNSINQSLYSKSELFYGEKGVYGGNQGSPQKNVPELMNIVRRHYPNMNDKDIGKYLKTLNSEGCGYVAYANTIFDHFVGNPKGFQEKFKFAMYKADGSPNYNALITDFYAATDNHNNYFGQDTVNMNIFENISGGTTAESLKYRFESYMKNNGINAETHINQIVEPRNFEELSQKYDVILLTRPVRLITEDGIPYNSDGGHAMKIIDVTNDGKYIVSSWGKKFYFDPKENLMIHQYNLVEYK